MRSAPPAVPDRRASFPRSICKMENLAAPGERRAATNAQLPPHRMREHGMLTMQNWRTAPRVPPMIHAASL